MEWNVEKIAKIVQKMGIARIQLNGRYKPNWDQLSEDGKTVYREMVEYCMKNDNDEMIPEEHQSHIELLRSAVKAITDIQ